MSTSKMPRQVVEPDEPAWTRSATLALVVITVFFFALRMSAASVVGFGDSEALYATWALHPQPAFLDHPGLVGAVARAIGSFEARAIPTPFRAHAITAVVATLVPWLVFAAARAFGAPKGHAALAALAVAVTPETAIGLFALTPDTLLAPAWLGALALAAMGLRSQPGSNEAAGAFLGAGVLAGVAAAAKVSGLLLIAALLVTFINAAFAKLSGPFAPDNAADRARAIARDNARSLWPWAGLLAGLITLVPIAAYEAKLGFPMLHHRLIATQANAGLAVRNAGALLGGQLLYLSPGFAILGVLVARDLVLQRRRDPLARLLFFAFAISFFPLLALCLWSEVAEPHWLAPSLLALPIHAARRIATSRGSEASENTEALTSRRRFVVSTVVAMSLSVAVHVWVLVPACARYVWPENADPKLNLANELYGWPIAAHAIEAQIAALATPFDPEGREVVVVGPHWTVCAQIQAALPNVRVGCATPIRDDFDTWLPRADWMRAEHVIFVTDNRFPGDGSEYLRNHVRTAQSRVRFLRAGRPARVFEMFTYERRAQSFLSVGE